MTKLTLKSTLPPEIQAKLAEAMGKIPEQEKVALRQEAEVSPKNGKAKKVPTQMKKDWKGRLEKIKAVQAWLEETWPAVFNLKEPKPLKRHIEQDILTVAAEKFSMRQVRNALHAYISRQAYLQAVLTADGRYNLNGERVEDIFDNEKEYSQQALEIKEQKFQERRAQQKKHKGRKLSQKAGGKAGDKEQNVKPSPHKD